MIFLFGLLLLMGCVLVFMSGLAFNDGDSIGWLPLIGGLFVCVMIPCAIILEKDVQTNSLALQLAENGHTIEVENVSEFKKYLSKQAFLYAEQGKDLDIKTILEMVEESK